MDTSILKHYIGSEITLTYKVGQEELTQYGRLLCYDIDKDCITFRETIVNEIPLASIISFSLRGFDQLTFQDCLLIISQIYSNSTGWVLDKVSRDDFIIVKKEIDTKTLIKDYTYPIVFKKRENNSIEVAELNESGHFIQPSNYGKIYIKLINLGYLIA
jgi:hypothetical protein